MKNYEHDWETAAVRHITDAPDEPEFMECPYCGEITMPQEGGECTHCRNLAYF